MIKRSAKGVAECNVAAAAAAAADRGYINIKIYNIK